MHDLEQQILKVLSRYFRAIIAESIVKQMSRQTRVDLQSAKPADLYRLGEAIQKGIALFSADVRARDTCQKELNQLFQSKAAASLDQEPRATEIDLKTEDDIVIARGSARELCGTLGFPVSDQYKVATAVSELVRNVVQYAGKGRMKLRVFRGGRSGIEVVVEDNGPGIPNLDEILAGRYSSTRGLGKGLRGTRELMDEFDVKTRPGIGTRITIRKYCR